MEMQLLRCFVAVGEELHFSNAAERLRVAAPTLSEAIQRLEYGLGIRLFVRLRHGVTLTPAGHTFLPVARRVLAEFEEGVRAARIAEAQAARVLRVGYVCRIDPELISAITAEFQRRRREWRLEMRRAEAADPAAGFGEAAGDGGNAVTLLRLPMPGADGTAGTLEGILHTRRPPAEPLSVEPFRAGPFMARPDATGTLREFLLTAERPVEQAPHTATDLPDLGDWFGAEAVTHQAIGIMTETSVAGSSGDTSPHENGSPETVSPSILSAVWPRGDTDPVIADFLQACVTAVRDHTPKKTP
ncbi:MAG: LysR family transcriptional regulator [Actinomadura sp.]